METFPGNSLKQTHCDVMRGGALRLPGVLLPPLKSRREIGHSCQ